MQYYFEKISSKSCLKFCLFTSNLQPPFRARVALLSKSIQGSFFQMRIGVPEDSRQQAYNRVFHIRKKQSKTLLNFMLDRFKIALIIKYNKALMRRVNHGYCLRESGMVKSWYISMIEEHLGAARGTETSRPGRNSPI